MSACDFDGDTFCDIFDINLTYQTGNFVASVFVGTENRFDLDANTTIDNVNLNRWLEQVATKNGYASPYRRDDVGKISPDYRDVDITDFNTMASNLIRWGSPVPSWWGIGIRVFLTVTMTSTSPTSICW